MTRRLRTALVALTCLSALALAGCGSSGFACDSASACSADDAPTADSIASCQAELDGACGAEFKAFGQCATDHQTCTADNTTDPASLSACNTQFTAYSDCAQNNP